MCSGGSRSPTSSSTPERGAPTTWQTGSRIRRRPAAHLDERVSSPFTYRERKLLAVYEPPYAPQWAWPLPASSRLRVRPESPPHHCIGTVPAYTAPKRSKLHSNLEVPVETSPTGDGEDHRPHRQPAGPLAPWTITTHPCSSLIGRGGRHFAVTRPAVAHCSPTGTGDIPARLARRRQRKRPRCPTGETPRD